MAQFRLAPAATQDIESILAWTQEKFSERARLRYEALLIRAIIDAAEQPDRVGSANRPEIAASVRSYHISCSRTRVGSKVGRVRKPRHFLLYRMAVDGAVEILRVLHDSMDLERHRPT